MIHSHCENCVKITKCTIRSQSLSSNEKSCSIIKCDNFGCEMMMHQCKLNDHQLICNYKKVSCINHNYGCNAQVLRHQISNHLIRCPANVIHCAVEWNRWPVHTKDRKLTSSKQILAQTLDINNLDVALALRDQRMLNQLWGAERRTRKIMSNYLTQKYPAVPFKPYRGIHVSNSLNKSNSPSTTTTESTCSPSNEETDSDSPWQLSKSPPGLQASVCQKLFGDFSSNHHQNQNHKLHKFEFSAVINPLKDDHHNHDGHGIPSPPALPRCNSLSLDINICSIAPHQKKPLLMYTFRCAQEFRRDEFEWHYKNCHNDIHGSIDGWMEHRCPLWQYGCGFVYRRWNPCPDGAKIVFNSDIESFGLQIEPNQLSVDESCDFESLPFEIWHNICRHLDSFSINNLSLTSKRLRDVCRTFLDQRGLVSLQWQRTQDENGKYTWSIAHKKWFFSCAFSPVSSWQLDSHHAVSKHLSSCPFNVKQIKTEPFKLPSNPKCKSESKKQI